MMLNNFLAMDTFVGGFIRELADLTYVIAALIEQLQAQHIVYAEVTIAVADYLEQGISVEEQLDCVNTAGEQSDVHLQWMLDLGRNRGHDAVLELLRQILALPCESVAGITLTGNEALFPPQQFEDVYHLAREHGLRTSIHAGEFRGSKSIWTAMDVLKVDRIAHAARAVEDKRLVEALATREIPLEICPTSDLWTELFPTYEEHSLHALIEAGVPLTVNSGSPLFFDTTLTKEYAYLHKLGMSEETLYAIMKNGFRHAFLPEDQIAGYLELFEQAWRLHQSLSA